MKTVWIVSTGERLNAVYADAVGARKYAEYLHKKKSHSWDAEDVNEVYMCKWCNISIQEWFILDTPLA